MYGEPDTGRIQALESALARAQAASLAKDSFLTSMSHELRDPLNAVLGFAHLLVRDALPPQSQAHVEHILKCGTHLVRLVEDIHDIARIETGSVTLSPEPVAVGAVVNEVVQMLAGPSERANVHIDVVAALATAPLAFVDRVRYAQILLNLGSNAVKYNRRGGAVTFALAAPSSATLRVCVIDTGVGIPIDKQASVFGAFERAGQESGSVPGTGLGLTLAKRLAELMGGAIGFESIPAQGSTFWVDAPRYTG
jgi:signal transduction histidine kinase